MEISIGLIVSGAILLSGILIFLALVFRKVKKHRAIKHYEEIRDKLSVREAEEETGITEEEYEGGFSLSSIIGGFISILVGFSLLPEITKQVNIATSSNVTGAASTILGIVPVMFITAILGSAIAIFSKSFREMGLA